MSRYWPIPILSFSIESSNSNLLNPVPGYPEHSIVSTQIGHGGNARFAKLTTSLSLKLSLRRLENHALVNAIISLAWDSRLLRWCSLTAPVPLCTQSSLVKFRSLQNPGPTSSSTSLTYFSPWDEPKLYFIYSCHRGGRQGPVGPCCPASGCGAELRVVTRRTGLLGPEGQLPSFCPPSCFSLPHVESPSQ